jgi:rod shape-determining protein MreB
MKILPEDVAVILVDDAFYFHTRSRTEPLCLPAYVAVQAKSQKPLAFGEEAKRMFGMTHENIEVRNVLKEGLIDAEPAEFLFKTGFVQVLGKGILIKPRVILAARNTDPKETRWLKDITERAGAREVYLIDFAMAAAIGMKLVVTEPALKMVLSLSNDWFEFAVISLAGILVRVDGAIGLRACIEDLQNHLVLTRGFRPDTEVLETQVRKTGVNASAEIPGWEAWVGNPALGRQTWAELRAQELGLGMLPSLVRLAERIKAALRTLPHEHQAKLYAIPVHACGNAFETPGLRNMLSTLLGHSVQLTDAPYPPAVDGCITVLGEIGKFNKT